MVLYILDFYSNKKIKVAQISKSVTLLSYYQNDLIVASDGYILKILKLGDNNIKIMEEKDCIITALAIGSKYDIIIGLKDIIGNSTLIKIINLNDYGCRTINLDYVDFINAINVYFDGRIIVGANSKNGNGKNLFIVDARFEKCKIKSL